MIRETCIVIFSVVICLAQTAGNSNKLAIESNRYCTSTAAVKATPQMIIDKVNQACAMIEKVGTRAFPKFKGKGSDFIFAGTYIWINDLNGKILMHPVRPDMENQMMIGLTDYNGKLFLLEAITLAKNNGNGWVDYSWKKPNSKKQYTKLIYARKSVCNGTPVVVACSIDDITAK
jgi:signal transduction histidine kinase